jgi:hypothetical protein
MDSSSDPRENLTQDILETARANVLPKSREKMKWNMIYSKIRSPKEIPKNYRRCHFGSKGKCLFSSDAVEKIFWSTTKGLHFHNLFMIIIT